MCCKLSQLEGKSEIWKSCPYNCLHLLPVALLKFLQYAYCAIVEMSCFEHKGRTLLLVLWELKILPSDKHTEEVQRTIKCKIMMPNKLFSFVARALLYKLRYERHLYFYISKHRLETICEHECLTKLDALKWWLTLGLPHPATLGFPRNEPVRATGGEVVEDP